MLNTTATYVSNYKIDRFVVMAFKVFKYGEGNDFYSLVIYKVIELELLFVINCAYFVTDACC